MKWMYNERKGVFPNVILCIRVEDYESRHSNLAIYNLSSSLLNKGKLHSMCAIKFAKRVGKLD